MLSNQRLQALRQLLFLKPRLNINRYVQAKLETQGAISLKAFGSDLPLDFISPKFIPSKGNEQADHNVLQIKGDRTSRVGNGLAVANERYEITALQDGLRIG